MSPERTYPLLDRVSDPSDLRQLPLSELPQLAAELREYLIYTLSSVGGHFAAGLGVVELTIALHYAYDTPYDRVVWDIGHQCYPHKVLTGRREELPTIRRKGGLSGFLKRSESEYDCFGAGHSSTSISAALGMSIGAGIANEPRKVAAVIGDGAMTAGMAYEALNHGGDVHNNMLVILNDNDMSISPNVGALSKYLARILTGRLFTTVKSQGKHVLGTVPPMLELARRTEEHVKGMLVPATLFEEFGFNYTGPMDGHDVITLAKTLKNIREMDGPQFLHVVTTKGKGYKPAEKSPVAYHAVSAFDPSTGEAINQNPGPITYTKVFGQWLCDMAERDDRLIGITPAMREGSGMVEFSDRFPDRYFDVGIAEQHAVTLAAGMACEGAKPVVAIYSTFLQRAYDQLVHDVAIQNLPVLFAIDRAGLVGADGATHAGNYDLAFLRCIPNMIIMAPSNEDECRQMLYTGFQQDGPVAVRYPRGAGPGVETKPEMTSLTVGKAEVLRKGHGVAILAFGSMVKPSREAGDKLNATVVNMRFVKPLDAELVLEMASSHDLIVTVEENAVMGGAGSAVNELLNAQKCLVRVCNLGLPDEYIHHGRPDELLDECGLNGEGIFKSIEQELALDLTKEKRASI